MVNLTTTDGVTFSADKTFEEIVQAYNARKYSIVAIANGTIIPLADIILEHAILFINSLASGKKNNVVLITIVIDSNNEVQIEMLPLATIYSKLPNPKALTFTGAVTGSYDGSSAKTIEIPVGVAGKSAYQYAQDGGYTGTETEFAAKLAQEKFANPNALTFTGAVEGSYDGSAPLTVEIPGGGSGSSDAWNLIEHITAEDAAISYEIPLQPGAKEYGIYWKYTLPDGVVAPMRDIKVDESLAQWGVMYRCQTNENLFLRVFKGPSNILAMSQNTSYAATRFSNGGTYIGTGTDFPAMTLQTDKACTTSEIWVYWR